MLVECMEQCQWQLTLGIHGHHGLRTRYPTFREIPRKSHFLQVFHQPNHVIESGVVRLEVAHKSKLGYEFLGNHQKIIVDSNLASAQHLQHCMNQIHTSSIGLAPAQDTQQARKNR
jgi:hypothetical protein